MDRKTEIEILEIEDGTSGEFEEAVRIYEDEFPPKENVSRETFVRILLEKKEGRFDGAGMIVHLLGMKFRDEMIGVAACNYFTELNLGFIEYFCVASNFQGQGFGRVLIKRILKVIIEDAKRIKEEAPIGVIFEVVNEEIEEGRLFKREGAKSIKGINYLQLSFVDHQPIPLGLKVFPFDRKYWEKLTPEKIIQIVKTVCKKVYVFKNNRPYYDQKEVIEKFTNSIQPEELGLK